MKVIHYYPSVYTMFKQMAEKSLTDSSFVLQSKELEDYEKTKGGKVELDPEIKLSQLVLDIEKNIGSNIIYIDPSVFINQRQLLESHGRIPSRVVIVGDAAHSMSPFKGQVCTTFL